MKRTRPNVTDRNADIKNRADEALGDEAKLAEVVEQLAVGSRRERQNAASVLHIVAKADADVTADILCQLPVSVTCENLDVLAM